VEQEVTSNKAQVLIVDDNENLRVVIAEILKSDGYGVITADNAEQAQTFLTNAPPDIIICDIMMPDTDGYQLYSQVKQNPKWASVPFIFLSALSEPAQIRTGKALGVDDYLTKPFDATELLAVIEGKLCSARVREKHIQTSLEISNRRVIHTLSHEFRTPLVSINTGTELLLEQQEDLDADSVRQLLESVYRGGQRLQRLVDDFMLLQQIDSGFAEVLRNRLKKPFSLLAIAETAISVFQETIFESDTGAEIRLVNIDEANDIDYQIEVYDIHIINVIQRLLSNARKFAGADKPINVEVGQDEDQVWFSVIDKGPGLPDGVVKEALILFRQIEREKYEQQGCGLGLTIANYFIELNSGKLEFIPFVNNSGLEVKVTFPRVTGKNS